MCLVSIKTFALKNTKFVTIKRRRLFLYQALSKYFLNYKINIKLDLNNLYIFKTDAKTYCNYFLLSKVYMF